MERQLTRLAWLALLVVDEAAELGAKEPVLPSLGLRLALGYLHSIADGPTFALPSRRHVFDEFWRTVTGPIGGGNPNSAQYARAAAINSCLQQIGRQIGQYESLFNMVRATRRSRALAGSRAQLATVVRQFTDAEDERKMDRRRYYWRPPSKAKD